MLVRPILRGAGFLSTQAVTVVLPGLDPTLTGAAGLFALFAATDGLTPLTLWEESAPVSGFGGLFQRTTDYTFAEYINK